MKPLQAAAAACLFVTAGVACADAIELEAARDNTLFGSRTGHLSNGMGMGIYVGRTSQPNDLDAKRRGLIQFDVSPIPAGSTVNSVVLHLNLSQTLFGTLTQIELHRLEADWGEGVSNAGPQNVCQGGGGTGATAEDGDATWLHTFYPDSFWSTPGGDFSEVVSAVTTLEGPGTYWWSSTPELVADVQAWVDGAAGNFGWLLLGDESLQFSAKRFDSREAIADGCPSELPRLVVDFTPPVDCPGDTNADGAVDVQDLVAVITAWGSDDAAADVNGDGTVDVQDLVGVINGWGTCS